MPYKEKVFVRSKKLEVSKTMSPLKMFDYLSNRMVIIASDLRVYNHILINNFNSILIKPNNLMAWNRALIKINNQKFKKKLKKKCIPNSFKVYLEKQSKKNYKFFI